MGKGNQGCVTGLIPIAILALAAIACVQDCIGVNFSIRGHVTETTGEPIPEAIINVRNDGSYEQPPFDLTVTSNRDGYFETDSVFSYACTTFEVGVSADGFEPIVETYYPPSEEGLSPILPNELSFILEQALDNPFKQDLLR